MTKILFKEDMRVVIQCQKKKDEELFKGWYCQIPLNRWVRELRFAKSLAVKKFNLCANTSR